jgi:lantibiotic modifying enzyme
MWRSVVQGDLRTMAQKVAVEIAARLRDPERVLTIAALAMEQSRTEFKQRWSPLNVAYGDAGLALFFGQMDRCFPNQSWDRVAHTYIANAGRALEAVPTSRLYPAMIGGLAGLCFTTHYLSRDRMRYGRLLATLDELLTERVIASLPPLEPFLGVGFSDYDQISGPAGIGAYLLLRNDLPHINRTLDIILDRLLFLSEWQDGHLRFFIPPNLHPTSQHLEQRPHGATNCGLAHGVPGPLAFLSLAHLSGIERPGLCAAIRCLADWVAAQRFDDEWGINWPSSVPPDERERSFTPTRAAWCYGSPGVARALWLAGQALKDSELQALAVEAVRAVRRRPIDVRAIPAPIICHGVAGLLQIVLRFANDTSAPDLAAMAEELTQELLEMYDPALLVGFQNIEPRGQWMDDPGLLNGAAGVALVLLAAATDTTPLWDRMFLLS